MTDPAHAVAVVAELSARWYRVQEDPHADNFQRGRAEGYVQAISLLLKVEHRAVLAALKSGELK